MTLTDEQVLLSFLKHRSAKKVSEELNVVRSTIITRIDRMKAAGVRVPSSSKTPSVPSKYSADYVAKLNQLIDSYETQKA